MRTLQEHLSASPQSDLYHYTTIAGFLGIVDSMMFWATDIYYMNDTKELVYAGDIVNEVVEDALRGHKHSTEIAGIFRGGIYNSQYANIFSISFTESRDLLSQWRGYGGDSGMAVCFAPAKLSRIAECNHMRLVKCIYDREQQVQIITELCERHIAEVTAAIEGGSRFSPEEAARSFFRDLCDIGPILKHPSFKDEGEWRMLSESYDMVYNGNLPWDRMGFRAGRSTIIPYLKVQLSVDYKNDDRDLRQDLGFHDVLIGPSAVAELPWRAVMAYLTARNVRYNQITPSGVPLRGSV
ncbi:hypothetical protein H261_21566 [Paramagnetospirillum caucaseum]|uniref:DUF2971 domain-containing protein n=1 Tax=Paramagnetospirillum caucaseum TaxID=1244869 RepID=M3A5Q3_9PROT|nr:DUF2971 domain-containing protein [Paramagnetospirillum caucaseum]EME67814.1 hypothetical protein H261_21566 [Paramagnetospirillum caucaseum]